MTFTKEKCVEIFPLEVVREEQVAHTSSVSMHLFHNVYDDHFKYSFMCISISFSGIVRLSAIRRSKESLLPNEDIKSNLDANKGIYKMSEMMKEVYWVDSNFSSSVCGDRITFLHLLIFSFYDNLMHNYDVCLREYLKTL